MRREPREDRAIAWLLGPKEPAMRYLASRDLLPTMRGVTRPKELRTAVPRGGWAAAIPSRQREGARWERGDTAYWPKVRGT